MSGRGMMTATVKGKKVDVIPFVGIKPVETAGILSRYFGQKVSYEPHYPKSGGADGFGGAS